MKVAHIDDRQKSQRQRLIARLLEWSAQWVGIQPHRLPRRGEVRVQKVGLTVAKPSRFDR